MSKRGGRGTANFLRPSGNKRTPVRSSQAANPPQNAGESSAAATTTSAFEATALGSAFTFNAGSSSSSTPAKTAPPAPAPASPAIFKDTSSIAHLKKENEKKDGAIAEYHDTLANYEQKIDNLNEKESQTQKSARETTQQLKALKQEQADTQLKLDSVKATLEKRDREFLIEKTKHQNLKIEKAKVDKTNEDHVKTLRDNAELIKNLRSSGKADPKANKETADLLEKNIFLEEELTNAKKVIDDAEIELQDIFGQDEDTQLDRLLWVARNTQKSQNQHDSFDEDHDDDDDDDQDDNDYESEVDEFTPRRPRSTGRLISGASLQQELDDANYASSRDGEDDNVGAFQEVQSVSAPPQPEMTFSEIIAVETSPIAAPTKSLPEQDLSFSKITIVETSPIAAPTKSQPEQVLSFSEITAVETYPSGQDIFKDFKEYIGWQNVRVVMRTGRQVDDLKEQVEDLQRINKQLEAGIPEDVKTIYVDKPVIKTVTKLVRRDVEYVPGWYKLVGSLFMLILLLTFSALIGERNMWSEANDLARARAVNVGISGASDMNPTLSFFDVADSYMGRPRGALLG